MILYYALHAVLDFAFVDNIINPTGIAICHSIFNIATTVLLLPFSNQLVTIAMKAIKTEPESKIAFLDERLFDTPPVAVSECNRLSLEMANMARKTVKKAIDNLFHHNNAVSDSIAELESKIDIFEDHLGSISYSQIVKQKSLAKTKATRDFCYFHKVYFSV